LFLSYFGEDSINELLVINAYFADISDFNKYAKSGQMYHRARRKRSYRNVERTVETLVVVDRELFRKHGRENVTTYILSIFNIVGTGWKQENFTFKLLSTFTVLLTLTFFTL